MQPEADKYSLLQVGKELFYKSLVGLLYRQINNNLYLTTDQLLAFLRNNEIQKHNGKTYTLEDEESARQALFGTISTNVFKVVKDTWTINKDKAKAYKHHKIRKYCNTSAKSSSFVPVLNKTTRLSKRISMLERLLAEVEAKPGNEKILKHPFEALEGSESIIEAGEKIGKEKFIGIIEGYLITTKYCKVYVVAKIMDKRHKNSTGTLQQKIESIQDRVKRLEIYFEGRLN